MDETVKLKSNTANYLRHCTQPAGRMLLDIRCWNHTLLAGGGSRFIPVWILYSHKTNRENIQRVQTVQVAFSLNADSNRTFLACVLMIDSVMPFRSGFAHGGH